MITGEETELVRAQTEYLKRKGEALLVIAGAVGVVATGIAAVLNEIVQEQREQREVSRAK